MYWRSWGTAVAQWLRWCATNRKVAGSIPAGVSGFFIVIESFRSHYGPGVESAPNTNEYQEYFLGVKGGRCLRLTTLSLSCAVVTKSGNFNILESSGPAQAFNGTALLLLTFVVYIYLVYESGRIQKFPDWFSSEMYACFCYYLLFCRSDYFPTEFMRQVQHNSHG